MGEEKKRPKVGIGSIVINDKNQVLLGYRTSKHGGGTWCPPGGHLEMYESFEECAARETLEEAGIKVSNGSLFATTNDVFEESGKHYVTICINFKYSDVECGVPKVMEPDKCEKWEWFDWDNLPSPLFVSFDNLVKTGKKPF